METKPDDFVDFADVSQATFTSKWVGLTKREYFAGLVCAAMFTNVQGIVAAITVGKETNQDSSKVLTALAVVVANDLIEALNK